MVNIVADRGKGKSYELVKQANINYMLGHKTVVVIPSRAFDARYLRDMGLKNEIDVVSVSELKDRYEGYDVFIDQIDILVQHMLGRGAKLAMFTSNKEDIMEVNYGGNTNA